MADAQLVAGDHHAHALTDQPPPHRIGVAVNPDHTVRLHLAHQLERHRKRRSASDREQSSGRRTPEALDRYLTGRAVLPLISDIGGQLSKRRPAIAWAHARSACWRYHAASWSVAEACPESRPAISSHVPRRGQLERFVDVDVALGHASRGVTQERGDRQLGEAEVTSDAAEGMSQGVGCDALDLLRGAEARQAALRRREMAVADVGGEDIRAVLA